MAKKKISVLKPYEPPQDLAEHSVLQSQRPEDGKLFAAKFNVTTQNALYSSITGIMQSFFISLLPKNFFKTLFIQNSIHAVTEQALHDDEKMVKDLPALSMLLNYEPQENTFNGDSFLEGNIFTLRSSYLRPSGIVSHIIRDWNEQIYVTAPVNRIKNTFEVTFTVDSDMQALNLSGYLRSKLGLNRPMYLTRRIIEVPLPMSVMGAIARTRGFDLNDKDSFAKFVEYIKLVSNDTVVWKLHNTSGKKLFFFRYFTNILYKVTSFGNIESEKDNKALMEARIKLEIEVEYNHHSYYIVESFQNLVPPEDNFVIDSTGIGATIHWTLPIVLRDQLDNGMKCFLKVDIVSDINKPLDVISLEDVLSTDIVDYIDHVLETKDKELDNFLLLTVVSNGEELDDEQYFVDWKGKEVTLINPKENYDYKILLYGDMTDLLKYTKPHKNKEVNNVIVYT